MKLPLFVLAAITAFFTSTHGQTLDIPPRGAPNERAVEGGSYRVNLDTTTPLPALIKRLTGQWNLVETRKAYWIGYTDDMYSIAAFKDAAIPPLLALFKESKDSHTKAGVIFTLHLIGINSTIVGRFSEKFLNARAREALLGIIDDEQVGELAVQLLARDPWPTDVQKLVSAMVSSKRPRNVLICAMFRYVQGETPFRQNIDESWDTIAIDYKDSKGFRHLGDLKTTIREKRTDNPETINALVRSDFVIQWGKEGRILRKLINNDNGDELRKVLGNQKPTEALNDLFRLSKDKVSVFSFCDLDDQFWHHVEPHRIVIVAPEIAQQMWVDYFRGKGLSP